MKKYILLLILTAIFCYNCSKHTDKFDNASLETITVNPDKITKEENASLLIDTTYFEFIALETNDDCLIGRIKKVYLRENKILVYDELVQAVYFFDRKDGSYLGKLHAVGGGPEEYPSDLHDIVVTDTHIGVIASFSNKILLYDFEGKFVKYIRLDNSWGRTFFTFDNKDYYLVNNWGMCSKGLYNFYKLDAEKQKAKGFLAYDKKDDKVDRGWGLQNFYSKYNDTAHIIISTLDYIYKVTPDKDIEPQYYVDITKKKISREDAEGDGTQALHKAIKEKLITGIDGIRESSNFIILDFFRFKVVYDKRRQLIIATTERFRLDNSDFFIELGTSASIENDYLINVFDLSFYEEHKADIKRNYYKYISPLFKKKFTEAFYKIQDETDNPIIMIYKLK